MSSAVPAPALHCSAERERSLSTVLITCVALMKPPVEWKIFNKQLKACYHFSTRPEFAAT
jgi:hypothetical protein